MYLLKNKKKKNTFKWLPIYNEILFSRIQSYTRLFVLLYSCKRILKFQRYDDYIYVSSTTPPNIAYGAGYFVVIGSSNKQKWVSKTRNNQKKKIIKSLVKVFQNFSSYRLLCKMAEAPGPYLAPLAPL